MLAPILIEAGASVSASEIDGQTPEDAATEASHRELAAMLKASPHQSDHQTVQTPGPVRSSRHGAARAAGDGVAGALA